MEYIQFRGMGIFLSYQLNFSNQEIFSEIFSVLPKANVTLKNKARFLLTENTNNFNNLKSHLGDFTPPERLTFALMDAHDALSR